MWRTQRTSARSPSFLGLLLVAACSSTGSDGTSGACNGGVENCADVSCPCADGTSQSFGKSCFAGKCTPQSICTRAHGFCANHGGVAGAPTGQRTCTADQDCPVGIACFADGSGKCASYYDCFEGHCLWDDACKTGCS